MSRAFHVPYAVDRRRKSGSSLVFVPPWLSDVVRGSALCRAGGRSTARDMHSEGRREVDVELAPTSGTSRQRRCP